VKSKTTSRSVTSLDAARLGALASIGPQLVETLDLERILARLLAVAREATGAHYAAIGVLDARREHLERFITDGIDEPTRAQIGDPPHGHGILGELIRRPEPLRLDRLGDHPRSYGFPPDHPPMASFLGVPVIIRGEVWGNLYLTETNDGEPFTEADEKAVLLLASWAAIAIDHARLYEEATLRRDELQTAVTALEATGAISAALGGQSDSAHVLELVVKRGRALIGARVVALFLCRADTLQLGAAAGETASVPDQLPLSGNLLADVMETQRVQRVERSDAVELPDFGFPADSAIFVPLSFRGETFGVLAAIGNAREGGQFDRTAEDLLTTFAVNAGAAVATARQLEQTLQDRSLAAAEAERGRLARELHDETLQELAAIKLALVAAAGGDDIEAMRAQIREIADRADAGARALQHLINDPI
jgi:GAF domain-containing protein